MKRRQFITLLGGAAAWPIAARAQQTRAILRAHDECVNDVGFSPDGGLLASTGDDGNARLWDPRTVAELARDGTNLDPIQEIGIRNMTADYGYCTAGWLTVAKTFLQKNPNPTEDEIKDALAGHLCRCSAYAGIIKTVKDTPSYMREEATL